MINQITLIGAVPPPYGGISIHMKLLTEKLVKKGFKVEIIDFTGVKKKLQIKNTKLTVVKKAYSPSIFKALLKSNSQIFHAHASTYRVDPFLLFTGIMSRLRRRKFVITIHGGAFVKFMNKPLYRRIFRLIALNLAHSTIAFDQAIFKKLIQILPPKKRKTAHYFPHPVNTELFNPETSGEEVKAKYGIKKDQCMVLFGPHLEPVYIPDQFIEAASLTVKKKPNVKFMLIGGGPQETKLKDLVKKLKLEKFAIFVSSVPHEQMPQYFAACDVACNPCILGQGIFTFEALACGKPVIGASAKTQIRIKDKVDGLLFDPGDIEDLASKIGWLLEHPEKRREMGMLGRSRVVKQNSLEAQVQDHVRIYQEITSK